MRTSIARVREDHGSVLVLGIGMAVLLVSVVTIAVNVTTIWISRTTLNAVADGAALAGAQAVSTDDIYRNGIGSRLVLDPGLATKRVHQYLSSSPVRQQMPGLRLVKVEVIRDRVVVHIAAHPNVPFGYFFSSGEVLAQSRAIAVNQVR
ncbi:MAG: hypothetical protein F2839_02040 [Actinobacteria bacterium]|uniref:Unannotated protein n=1 Tax=freshwater metagenome TaxID=449393 RepID=A0A6J5YZM5_9ZZZZ|nr:hypothetical protein [Actinomycetota bacterium]